MTDVTERVDRQAEPLPPDLGPVALARWAWRQLTSMRTALILLFLLALAAVPGSVVPQEGVDPQRVARWKTDHASLTPIYEKLGLFDVYASPWFAAIYVLLTISLVGCILPRTKVYWRAARAQPPSAPRRLERLPEHRVFEVPDDEGTFLERARRVVGKDFGYRVRGDDAAGVVSAERGYMREAGNLIFHLAILVVLVGFAWGALLGFKGGVIVVTGDGFSNSVSQYDDFDPGALFSAGSLKPFTVDVKKFDVRFITKGRGAGSAQKFVADLGVRSSPTAAETDTRIRVNKPLNVDGTKVFLIGHGYAPHITVRDGEGNVVTPKSTVFLPESADFRSFGVVKAADALPEQIGLEGEFYPTYAFTQATGPFSAYPDAKNPAISMLAYEGDLGLDSGDPQSVYSLDKKGLKPIRDADGKPLRIDLPMGATKQLPDGLGSVTFDGLSRFVRLQVSSTPGTGVALGGTILALIGLCGSLFIRPRRVWLRTRREGDRTIVTLAGLDRSSGGDLAGALDRLQRELDPAAATAGTSGEREEST
ncbi:cytochrome c biosynthesis protein [Marmoricola endophyticus]|uniref:Cytochrome c biosynthesis protein n=1 Tax=Marmoricola endophyticus TaxID=2040280 RepID=A0A917BJG4_9ACTN|nr:cytochrome c biogenesis protein ResB [Marmoricola endophyticus]GGF45216.1 cytochrome c biosynthesis protein [Marmoricola endophyticus]